MVAIGRCAWEFAHLIDIHLTCRLVQAVDGNVTVMCSLGVVGKFIFGAR